MSWKVYQRIFELAAVGLMMAGIVLMWQHSDPRHLLIYFGFILLATGKLIEAFNLVDPNFRIIKITACICIYLLTLESLLYSTRSLVYIMVPLGIYYLLHYRLMFQQRKS